MWCYSCIYFAILTCALVVQVRSELKFLSTPDGNITVEIYSPVLLHCRIIYSGSESLGVTWTSLTDHRQLTFNRQVLSSTRRISVEYYDRIPLYIFNLKIFNVTAEDIGLYECRATQQNGTSIRQITSLTVRSEPTYTPPVAVPINFTDCCVSSGVSSECWSLCASNTTQLSLLSTSPTCYNEAFKILKCGSDGRNHVSCCNHRGVKDTCLELCQIGPDSNNTTQSCLTGFDRIVSCFAIGQAVLPSAPSQLYANPQSSNTIFVSWSKPNKNGDTVTSYRIFYRVAGYSNPLYSTTKLSGAATRYILRGISRNQNLLPETTYEIHMVAYNIHGSSVPSYTVTATTLPVSVGYKGDYVGCCQQAGVSDRCVRSMCVTNTSITATAAALCVNDLNKVLTCYSGSVDFISCCRNIGIPDKCLSICGQSSVHIRWDQMECLKFIEETRSCFLQDSPYLPGPPTGVRLGAVKSDRVQVLWNQPTKNPEKVERYDVHYALEAGSSENKLGIATSSNAVNLLNLASSTRYWVQVSAVGVNGSSMPSSKLYFDTTTSGGADEWVAPTGGTPTAAPSVDRNFTACCVEKGVSNICMPLCDYGADISSLLSDLTITFTCPVHAAAILTCATGGADHTPCCAERGLSKECQKLCRTSNGDSLDSTVVSCLPFVAVGLQCAEEGSRVLPSAPEQFSVTGRDTSSIRLFWTAPSQSPAGVEGYLITYKLDLAQNFVTQFNVSATNASSYSYTLQNLAPDTTFYITVSAYNRNGSSLPTPTVRVNTLPTNVSPTPPSNGSDIDNTACCTLARVQPSCLVYCNGSTAVPSTQCSSELSKILKCVSGQSDHTPCCMQSNVPSECLGLCNATYSYADTYQPGCLAHIPSVFTCIHVGSRSLPSPPERFSATSGTTYFILTWDPPARNPDNVVYHIFVQRFRGPLSEQKEYKNVSDTFYKVVGLIPGTTYQVYAIAENIHGASLPSSTFYAATVSMAPVIKEVGHKPEGVISEGNQVEFFCSASGTPPPTLRWIDHDRNQVSNSSKYVINRVDRRNRGLYVCVASNGIPRDARLGSYLDVVYRPIVSVESPITYVEPGKGNQVLLKCFFEGNVTETWWTRRTTKITTGGRYKVKTAKQHNLRGTESILGITSVVRYDLTIYTCYGKNNRGTAKGDIMLEAASDEPLPPGPTSSPLPAVPDVQACCIQKNVSQPCLVLCGFDLMSAQKLQPGDYAECAQNQAKIMTCQADGRDHTQCCRDAGVDYACQDFCRGKLPNFSSVDEQLRCSKFTSVMFNCLQMGHERIPTAPLNVNATYVYTVTRDTGLQIQWTYPAKNRGIVESYHVFYQQRESTEIYHATVDKTLFKYVISSHHLIADSVYKIWLTAVNNYGSSLPSAALYATYQGVLPSAPRYLEGRVYNFTNIQLMWQAPDIRGHFDITYQVFYHQLSNITDSKNIKYNFRPTPGKTLNLTKLNPDTKYEMYVQAVNVYGSGPATESLWLTTSRNVTGDKPTGNKSMAASTLIGMGVGIGVAVLIVVLVVVIGVVWYIRIRNKRGVVKESVSFENPSYHSSNDGQGGRVQISGLPGEDIYSEPDDPRTNRFTSVDEAQSESVQYERLREQQPSENPIYDNLEAASPGIDVQTHL